MMGLHGTSLPNYDGTGVEFSPDGTRLLTYDDAGARVWPSDRTGTPVVLEGHEGKVVRARFDPSGERVVTASQDGTARVYRLDPREPVVLRGHGDAVTTAAFSPDGSHVVTGSEDDTARVWPVNSAAEEVVLQTGDTSRRFNFQRQVVFSPDGSRVATLSPDDSARVWRADGMGEPVVLRGHVRPLNSVAFSPTGSLLVTSSSDGTARVWRVDGSQAATVLRGHGNTVRHAAFNPDGSLVVTASWDGTARLWDVDGTGTPVILQHASSTEGQQQREPPFGPRPFGPASLVSGAWFGSNGARVVTGTLDVEPVSTDRFQATGSFRVWRLDGSEETNTFDQQAQGGPIAVSPGTPTVATGGDGGIITVWRTDGGGRPVELRGHTGDVRSAAYSDDGGRIVAGSVDGSARVWSLDGSDEPPIVLAGHDGSVLTVAFSPDGSRVLTGSDDGTARVWRVTWQGLVAHLDSLVTACLTPDKRMQFLAESSVAAQHAYVTCERRHGRAAVTPLN